MKNGWGEKTPNLTLVKNGMSLELSGERSLYLITSAQFGGKGVSLPLGVSAGLAVNKREREGLFCVDQNLHCVQPEHVLTELRARGAEEIVWEETMKIISPYLWTV